MIYSEANDDSTIKMLPKFKSLISCYLNRDKKVRLKTYKIVSKEQVSLQGEGANRTTAQGKKF